MIPLNEIENVKHPGVFCETIMDVANGKFILRVVFGIVGNNDLELEFYKEYESEGELLFHHQNFLNDIAGTVVGLWPSSDSDFENYDQTLEASTKALVEDVVNGNVELPEKGVGYVYDGERDYLKELLLRWDTG